MADFAAQKVHRDYKGNSVEANFETRMIAASLRHVLLVPSAITSTHAYH